MGFYFIDDRVYQLRSRAGAIRKSRFFEPVNVQVTKPPKVKQVKLFVGMACIQALTEIEVLLGADFEVLKFFK